jgi:hypothetical protein
MTTDTCYHVRIEGLQWEPFTAPNMSVAKRRARDAWRIYHFAPHVLRHRRITVQGPGGQAYLDPGALRWRTEDVWQPVQTCYYVEAERAPKQWERLADTFSRFEDAEEQARESLDHRTRHVVRIMRETTVADQPPDRHAVLAFFGRGDK